MLATNVTGYFLCCREAVKRMSHKHGGKGGAIVNVSSAASRLGAPGEYVDYAASKGAVDSLTTGLALEVAAQGIRVNCVRLGLSIPTSMPTVESRDVWIALSRCCRCSAAASLEEVAQRLSGC